jgi:dihydrofolate reductase
MKISLIAAIAANNVIGKAGILPWRLPADLARFRQLTWGHPIIMGRTTYDGIGKPLPGRTTIVITRQSDNQPGNCIVVHSLDAALVAATATGSDEVFVCGGGQIYRDMLPRAERLYITQVHQQFTGDSYFPAIYTETFRLISETPSSDTIPCTFQIYERCTQST